MMSNLNYSNYVKEISERQLINAAATSIAAIDVSYRVSRKINPYKKTKIVVNDLNTNGTSFSGHFTFIQ